jgi:hypothetical protein
MSQDDLSPSLDQPAEYRIAVVGRLSENWSEYFGGMYISTEILNQGQVVTCITGVIADQAGLHGLLRSIRDLGLPLLRVEWISNL